MKHNCKCSCGLRFEIEDDNKYECECKKSYKYEKDMLHETTFCDIMNTSDMNEKVKK